MGLEPQKNSWHAEIEMQIYEKYLWYSAEVLSIIETSSRLISVLKRFQLNINYKKSNLFAESVTKIM